MTVQMTHEQSSAVSVTHSVPEQRYGLEVIEMSRLRVVRALYRLGCDLVDQSTPGYLFVILNETQRDVVRAWAGVRQVLVVPGEDLSPAVSAPPVDDTSDDLVEITSGSCATLRGLLRARHGEKVEVEVFCFGRAMVVTVPAASVKPVALPEAWE